MVKIAGVKKEKHGLFAKKNQFFEGWYYKQQNHEESWAVIPAFYQGNAVVQVITREMSYQINYGHDYEVIRNNKSIPAIRMGQNYFSPFYVRLNIKNKQIRIKAVIKYSDLHEPKKNVMGIFQYVPWMPCIHYVYSMYHNVEGNLHIYDIASRTKDHIVMKNGIGYMEGDAGISFPKKYFWTQCSFASGPIKSIFISIAELPISFFCAGSFLGCTGAFLYKGKEYHVATWAGARVKEVSMEGCSIKQGDLLMKVTLISEGKKYSLDAPMRGLNSRIIKESISAKVRYEIWYQDRCIYSQTGVNAGYEAEW